MRDIDNQDVPAVGLRERCRFMRARVGHPDRAVAAGVERRRMKVSKGKIIQPMRLRGIPCDRRVRFSIHRVRDRTVGNPNGGPAAARTYPGRRILTRIAGRARGMHRASRRKPQR